MNITVSFTAGTGTASRTLPAYDAECVVALSGLTLEGSNYLYLTTREGAMALATRALVSANAATLNLNNTTIQSFIPATARQNYQARLTIRNISTGTVIGTALVEIEPTANPNADVTRVGVDYATTADVADLQSQIDTIDGGSLSDATPAALGTAAPGTGEEASRGDHIHPMPTAEEVGAEPTQTAATDGEITDGTLTEIRKVTPAQLKLAAETFGGTPETTIVEVVAATLQPGAHNQYVASNDLELLAPLTPSGSTLWETRIFMREGATLSYPSTWRKSGNAGAGANLATLQYLDNQWRITWTSAFDFAPVAPGTRLYVTIDGDDANDGYSWGTAKRTVGAALVISAGFGANEVWVAAGTYNAGNVDGFVIPAGVTVFGGFAGTESTLAEREHTAPTGPGPNTYDNETILTNRRDIFATAVAVATGTFGVQGLPRLYSCSLLASAGVCGAFGTGLAFALTDCTISGASITGNGGGANSCTLTACSLSSNSATNNGGGAHSCTLTACTLSGNSASSGGGAHTCTLTVCSLSGNSVSSTGGGAQSSTLTACTLSGNTATQGGGAHNNTLNSCIVVANTSSSTNPSGLSAGTAINCHILHNAAGTTGVPSTATARNCVFWRNKNEPTGTITNAKYDADLTLADFEAAADIAVGAPTGVDVAALLAAIEAHGYAPAAGSALIDEGDSSFVTTSTDYRGNPRIVGAAVDVGAYEYQGV